MKPHQVKRLVIPPQHNAEFVCQMEDVLTVYATAYNPFEPVVCLDEQPQVLHGHTRDPLPLEPGQCARVDDEYTRQGTANVFSLFEPLRGWRTMRVTQRRTLQDFAQTLKTVSDTVYPRAEVIHLVLNNLNTHKKAALYATFLPHEAARLAARFNVHHPPEHGSWLNATEAYRPGRCRFVIDVAPPWTEVCSGRLSDCQRRVIHECLVAVCWNPALREFMTDL